MAFLCFKYGVSVQFGRRAAQLVVVLTAAQFHLCFYMSRTLPNTFALLFCLVAFGLWLRGRAYPAICLVGAAMVVFRCDMLVLLAPLVLQLLLSQEVRCLLPSAVNCN